MEALLKSVNKKPGAHLFVQRSGYKRCLAKTSFHTFFCSFQIRFQPFSSVMAWKVRHLFRSAGNKKTEAVNYQSMKGLFMGTVEGIRAMRFH